MVQTPVGWTALVTGASQGIGRAAALRLAAIGAHVVLVARDPERVRAAAESIERATGNPVLDALTADLSTLSGVRFVAQRFLEANDRLDVLLNNVGGLFGHRALTVDGFERTVALNHLCPFLLTALLLPALRAGAGRVVNVSSSAHRWRGLDLDDMHSQRAGMGPGGFGAYARSKLMNLLFTYELARRERGTGVTANAMHPGIVASAFGSGNGRWMTFALRLARPWMRSPQEGADTAVFLATAAEAQGVTGRYYVDRQPVRSSPASYDRALQRGLWERSAAMVGLSMD